MAGSTPAVQIDSYLRQSTAVPPPSGSMSGDALGLDRKKLELNPRIKFNHRGQVAMALPLDESSAGQHDNEEESAMLRYQFFITLDEAPFLDAKNLVFGTIAGATMFNALRIGRTDADEQSGIPTDMKDAPPRIKSVKVDYHPFEDLVVTADKKIPWIDTSVNGKGKEGKQSAMEKRRKKRKGKRDLNVLSFGDEERNYEDTTNKSSKGGSMLSSHDVLSNESKFLSSKVDADVDKRSKEDSTVKKESGSRNMEYGSTEMKQKSSSKQDSSDTKPASDEIQMETEKNGLLGVERKESKSTRESSTEGRNHKRNKQTKTKSVGAVEARRAKYLNSGSVSSANKKERLKREGDTMEKLFAFKNKVLETKGSKKNRSDSNGKWNEHPADDSLASRMSKRAKQSDDDKEQRNREEEAFVAMAGYSGQVDDHASGHGYNDGIDGDTDWMGTSFKCKRHIDHDARMTALDKIGDENIGGDGRRMDDYEVLDEKRKKKGHIRHKDNREHGHHNGSGKHRERPHKSSGHRNGR